MPEASVFLGFRSIENIVEIAKWRDNNEISENWIKSNVYGEIYSIASSIEMIETKEGRKALKDSRMRLPAPVEETENDAETIIRVDPWKDQEDKKAALSDLLSDMSDYITPVGEECWLKAFSGYEQHKDKKITLKELSERAEEILIRGLDAGKVTPMEWLKKLYNACCIEKTLNTAIAAGQISIFPSQDKEDEKNKKLYPIGDIYIDNDIPEILKDITEDLDRLDNFDALCIRKYLINKDFLAKHTEIKHYPVERISEYISRRSARSYRVREFCSYQDKYIDAWHKAWDKLVSCGPDEDFYRMAACIKENPNEYKPLEVDTYGWLMWKSAYCSILEEMASEIEETSNIDGFVSEYHSIKDSEEACRFITDFVKCAKRYLGQLDNEIYPDQNGVFKNSRNLKKDAMNHEVLKDIMEVFSDTDEEYAIRKKLLDKRITETFQPIPDYKDSDAASKISNRIDGLLSSASLSEAEERYQEACGKLLYWIRAHIEEARTYFPSYYGDENQMKLLTPHAASILQKKTDQMDDIMERFEVSSPEELVKIIKEYKKLSAAGGPEETNDDPLIGDVYASEYDVFIGPDLAGADEDVLREIGVGGEKYALEQVVRHIRERGFETIEAIEGRYYRLKKLSEEPGKNEIVEVRYADHGNYHQSGYDISVTESVCGESDVPEESKVYYLEVKTHTPGSRYRNKIILSKEQMKLSASEGENYSVLNVVYDYNLRQGVSIEELKNPILLIGKGMLAQTQKKYEFILSAAA